MRSVFVLLLLCHALPAVAQGTRRTDPPAAELAIALGRLDDAETELYAASSRAPRDPVARAALGEFLAARGRCKVGAVLLTEARLFGGDARAIDARLARIYAWTGEWHLAAVLPSTPFQGAARERAVWLSAHPSTSNGPDSGSVRLEPNELAGLGRVAIEVGGMTLDADIDSRITGLVLPATPELLGGAQLFGVEDSTTLAAVYGIRVGGFSRTNVPVRFEPGARVRVGLDVLAPWTPTFDVAARRLLLRAGASVTPSGMRMPFLLDFPGVRVFAREGEAPVALESPAGRAALRGARWTFDVRRGAVFAERGAGPD